MITRLEHYFRRRGLYALWVDALWQLGLILFLFQIYEIGRGLIPISAQVARKDARQIMAWEQRFHLFDEQKVQTYLITRTHHVAGLQITPQMAIDFLNTFYLYAHFLGTASFLIWFYLFRRRFFNALRDTLFLATSIALVVFIVYPTAPPRMFHGFVDILAPLLDPRLQEMQLGYNPYAAMPSLHFIWALVVGGGLVMYGQRFLLRCMGVLYVLLMLTTIIGSANHYFLDCIASVIVVSASAGVVAALRSLRGGAMGVWLSRASAALPLT